MYYPPDGPAVVRVNIFVRSISKIDDVTMVSARNIKLNNQKKKNKKSNPSQQKIVIIIVKSEKYCIQRTCSALTSPMSIKVFHCACLPVYVIVYCPSNSSHMRAIELSNSAPLSISLSLPAPLSLTLTVSHSLSPCLSLSQSLFISSGCFSISRTYSYNLCICCQFYV